MRGDNLTDLTRQKGLNKCLSIKKQEKEERIRLYEKNPAKCQKCYSSLSYKARHNKFCNRSCAASYNNVSVARNYKNGRYGKKKCVNCGNKTCNKMYCSSECFSQHRWTKRKESYDSLDVLPSSGQWNQCKYAKKYLTEVRGHKCECCGLSEWLGDPIPLVLDHIDGNPSNWSKHNLRLLCGNCNMRTPTFAGKNKSNPNGGRSVRKVRYHQGLTY